MTSGISSSFFSAISKLKFTYLISPTGDWNTISNLSRMSNDIWHFVILFFNEIKKGAHLVSSFHFLQEIVSIFGKSNNFFFIHS